MTHTIAPAICERPIPHLNSLRAGDTGFADELAELDVPDEGSSGS